MDSEERSEVDHAVNVLSKLDNLRVSGTHCDFSIKVREKSFPVHKNVLSACSEYFRLMFQWETRQGFVEIKGFEWEAVKQCIDFMYTGTAEVTMDNIQAVLNAADVMQLDELINFCLRQIRQTITTDNCFLFKQISEKHKNTESVQHSVEFIAENLQCLLQTEGFGILSFEEISGYISLCEKGPEVLWEAMVTWIELDIEERKRHLCELMKIAKIEKKFPSSFLLDTAWKDSLRLVVSPQCKELVANAILGNYSASVIKLDNFLAVLEITQMYEHQSADAKTSVYEFIVRNFSEILKSNKKQFCELRIADLLQFIGYRFWDCSKQKRYPFRPKEAAWQAIVTWIQFDAEKRSKHLYDLLEAANFDKFSLGFLVRTVFENPMIQQSGLCLLLITQRMFSLIKEGCYINYSDCFILKKIVDRYANENRQELHNKLNGEIMTQFESAVCDSGFLDSREEDMLTYFSSPATKCKSEVTKWEAALKWVKHDTKHRRPLLPKLLESIRFEQLSVESIQQKIQRHPMVADSLECKDIVIDGLSVRVSKLLQ